MSNLPANQQTTALELSRTSRIGTLVPVEVEKSLVPILVRAHQILGYRSDAADVVFISGELERMLRVKYRAITISEVEEAIVNGASGFYSGDKDNDRSVSVRNITGWIRAYLSERNQANLKASNRVSKPGSQTLTDYLSNNPGSKIKDWLEGKFDNPKWRRF